MQSSSVGHTNVGEVLQKLMGMAEFMLTNVLLSMKSIEINQDINKLKIFLSYVDIAKLLFNFLFITVVKLRSRMSIINNVIELFNSKFVSLASNLIMMTIPDLLEPPICGFQERQRIL
jgi:hypothetical protein